MKRFCFAAIAFILLTISSLAQIKTPAPVTPKFYGTWNVRAITPKGLVPVGTFTFDANGGTWTTSQFTISGGYMGNSKNGGAVMFSDMTLLEFDLVKNGHLHGTVVSTEDKGIEVDAVRPVKKGKQ